MFVDTEVPAKHPCIGFPNTRAPEAPGPAQGLSWYSTFKLGVEFVSALLMFLASAPVVLVAAVLVKLGSPGPAFYSQVRIGKNGRPFRIYKIRSMYHNCERLSGPRWSTPGDPRVTRLGRFLRATHIDELPQLWNVLRGDMSLVGPRPERPEFVWQLEKALPRYQERLAVRPGITGLAQVQLPPDTDLESVRRKLAHDLYYIRWQGPWLDMQILLSTACRVAKIPNRALRKWLRVPSPEFIDETHQAVAIDGEAVLHVQLA